MNIQPGLVSKMLCIFALAIFSGCATVPAVQPISSLDPTPYLHDQLFAMPQREFAVEAPADFFALPTEFARELDQRVEHLGSEYERYLELKQWTVEKISNYSYVPTETFSLAELEQQKKINCLSFSILFVAAARHVNVDADFQLVMAAPYWDMSNDSLVQSQHINVAGELVMSPSLLSTPKLLDGGASVAFFPSNSHQRYVADINPEVVSVRVRRVRLDDQQVMSLFYGNKSIEYLLKGDNEAAYAYIKAALLVDPQSATAWNNLGVLYNRINQSAPAIAAYEMAFGIDQSVYSAKSNLAILYRNNGELDLAMDLEQEVAQHREQNPYYHFARAEQEIALGNYQAAKAHLQSAIRRKDSEPAFYHELAIINQKLGDMDAALINLQNAARFADGSDKTRYSNKLDALQSLL